MTDIKMFSDSEYQQFTGNEPMLKVDADSFESMFFAAETTSETNSETSIFDPELLPSTNGLLMAEHLNQIASDWLYENKVTRGINQLMSIKDINNDLAIELASKALPGRWNRIDLVSGKISQVTTPPANETGLIFDTETYVAKGNHAIIATAVSHKALYIWLCQAWDGITDYTPERVDLGNHKRLVVAHSISFDGTRIKQRYQLDNPVRMLCTKALCKTQLGTDTATYPLLMSNGKSGDYLRTIASQLDLVSLYNHLTGEPLPKASKDIRDIFVKAVDFQEFVEQGQALKVYAIMDTIYTLRIFQKILPMFDAWSKTPVILQGIIQSADSLMPISNDFPEWLEDCDANFAANAEDLKLLLKPYCDDIIEDWKAKVIDPIDYPGSWDKLDWKLAKPKGWRKKVLPEGFPELPKWFYSLYVSGDFKFGGNDLARLLRLRYKGQPLLQSMKNGWHIEDKFTGLIEKLPHSTQKQDKNVGNCLVRYYIGFVEDDLMSSDLLTKEDLLELMLLLDSTSIYSSYRDRFHNAETNIEIN